MLRLMFCGSVDDGKSTLIGRLLYESRLVFQDELAALKLASQQSGEPSGSVDFSLLLDGLQAEREQRITIDVAYRYFATPRRRFIVADAPGHEQYTRNMATAASTAEVAVVLVDARKGVLTQTRRHTRIAAMMGIRHVVLAVNKMDCVGYRREVFDDIVNAYLPMALQCGIRDVQPIPISAIDGDNLVEPSSNAPWYEGLPLLPYLEQVDLGQSSIGVPFRMPVQFVNRPDQNFRGYCGRVAAGAVHPGDRLRVWPSGVETRVDAIVAKDGDRVSAAVGDSITLTLQDDVDVSRGDVLGAVDAPLEVASQFEARLIWMSADPLVPGRPYLFKAHCKEMGASVMEIRHKEDVNTGAELAARSLQLNEIAVVKLATTQPLAFMPYEANRTLGGFILIDKVTFETVAAGMISFALRRSANIHPRPLDVDRAARAQLKHQTPQCVWFTGLSGSGKSTLANLLDRRLVDSGRHTYVLDGDNVRLGLNRDLGFTDADRAENIRRVAEVARLMVDAGLIVIVAFISPFRAERQLARELFAEGEFIEVFVDTPIGECERRDPKGLYAKARKGALPNFTGIDSPYETPESPEVHLRTVGRDIEACVEDVLQRLL